ncbi:unnamed protein product, partial [Gongylonema pulchrum]
MTIVFFWVFLQNFEIFRTDSDIAVPYGTFKRISSETPKEQIWDWNEVVRIAKGKTKTAFQVVSNCSTKSKRELYVEELKRHMNITLVGNCNNSPCDAECEENLVAQHRFYLAFENSVCRDYITEKSYKRMESLLVPIVFKKTFYELTLPPGSFIAADDF